MDIHLLLCATVLYWSVQEGDLSLYCNKYAVSGANAYQGKYQIILMKLKVTHVRRLFAGQNLMSMLINIIKLFSQCTVLSYLRHLDSRQGYYIWPLPHVVMVDA